MYIHQPSTNPELILFITELKLSFIKPIDRKLNDIRDLKKINNLTKPYKKDYFNLSIDELDTLLKRLVFENILL